MKNRKKQEMRCAYRLPEATELKRRNRQERNQTADAGKQEGRKYGR